MNDPDFDEMVLRYLDGGADPNLEKALRERLLVDEQARLRLATVACQQQVLKDIEAERAASSSPADRTPLPSRVRAVRRARPRGLSRPSAVSAKTLGAVAAGIVVVAALLVANRKGEEGVGDRATAEREHRRHQAGGAFLRAEEERREAEEKLKEVERERQRLAELRREAESQKRDDDRRRVEAEMARIEVERREAAAKLDKAREGQRQAREDLAQAPLPTPESEPRPRREPTVAAAGVLERVRGEVYVVTEKEKVPAQASRSLSFREGVETRGAESQAELRFPDGTKVVAEGDTVLRDLADLAAAAPGEKASGKHLFVAHGGVTLEVAKQPADRPMVVSTPHGEITVVGTTLRIGVSLGNDASTRVEVTEGRVRVKNVLDGKTIDVPSGHSAVAAPGVELEPFPAALAGYWKFDEGSGTVAKDLSRNGNHGTLERVAWVEGKAGTALRFGDRARVTLSVRGLPAANAPQTHAFWIQYDSVPRAPQVVVALQNEGSGIFSGFHSLQESGWSLGTWKFGGPFLASAPPPAPGKWHHFAYAFDGKVHRLYLNGSLARVGVEPPQETTPQSFSFGVLPAGSIEFFEGKLDEVRLYSRALSPREIQALASVSPRSK
jgi:hypothetical protein